MVVVTTATLRRSSCRRGPFPRGLAVGKIETVRKDPQGLFLEALVAPAVKFPKIEEVLVILSKRSGFDIRPGLEKTR